jgi:hypothetical protein
MTWNEWKTMQNDQLRSHFHLYLVATREIQAALEEDLANGARLMQPEYRRDALEHHVPDGYCAAAAAANFHLEPGGPRAAGLQPMQLNQPHGSHWWLSRRGGDQEVVLAHAG